MNARTQLVERNCRFAEIRRLANKKVGETR